MNIYRVTTNAMMYTYKNNLMSSKKRLSDATIRVQTERSFNSYAENPAAAARAFQLRRSHWNTCNQLESNSRVMTVFQQAESAIDKIKNDLQNKIGDFSALRGASDADASARNALGQTVKAAAEGMVQLLNTKYTDNYLFAGADGLNVPFTWDEASGELLYRGVNVNAKEGTPEYEKLKEMNAETTFVDLGLGMREDSEGNPIQSTVYNTAISGIDFLGFGEDADGDPLNAVTLMMEVSKMLCEASPEDGDWAEGSGGRERYMQLVDKLQQSTDAMLEKFVEHDAKSTFLKNNETQLTAAKDSLNIQINEVEDIDPAAAITDLLNARYSYNAGLQIGMQILSQSLLDYMK